MPVVAEVSLLSKWRSPSKENRLSYFITPTVQYLFTSSSYWLLILPHRVNFIRLGLSTILTRKLLTPRCYSPEAIDHMVCHETPTTSLLSAEESTDLIDFFFKLQDIYHDDGVAPAMEAFAKKVMVGMEDGPPRQQPERENPINQLENELLVMSLYCPDLDKIANNGTSVAVGFGTKSEGAMYKRTVLEQAKRLGCEAIEFPGHHQWFETQPEEFAPFLIAALGRLEEERNVKLGRGSK